MLMFAHADGGIAHILSVTQFLSIIYFQMSSVVYRCYNLLP